MRWNSGHESPNVDDRRSEGGRSVGGIGGLGGMLIPIVGRFGWKGLLVAGVVLVVMQSGVCQGGGSPTAQHAVRPAAPGAAGATEDELVHFVSFVFDDVQASWARERARTGKDFAPARLVIFRDAISTGCGNASAAVGPFYCPRDRMVYIDLSFYRELNRRFGAPGDFAQAYVIAHEVGHHIQNLDGNLDSDSARESIAVELMADCFAGVWARDAERRELLEAGDVGEALGAAAAVGDDRIQERSTGDVRPETWTHGSAKQREAAFDRGFRGGTSEACRQ